MEIVCIQADIAWEQKQENCRRVRAMLNDARPSPRALVLLPEMFASGFSMNLDMTADDDGAVRRFLADTARELAIFLMGGVVTRRPDGRGENRAIVFSPQGKEIASYSKMHPFRLGGESDHYAAGDQIVTFDWHGATVAPFICYDLRFPEGWSTYLLTIT